MPGLINLKITHRLLQQNRPIATVGAVERYVRSWMNSRSCWTVLKRRTYGYRAADRHLRAAESI